MTMKHILVDISGHGFGHLSQASAVLNALATLLGHQRVSAYITIRSTLDEAVVRERVRIPFNYVVHEQDKGMIMKDAIHVDVDASLGWYRRQHRQFDALLEQEIDLLRLIKPDLLFSDIPYLSLEAAYRLGVPSIALCSLNWYEILKNYCGNKPGVSGILEQIHLAYSRASLFLRPEPSLAMQSLENTRRIAPIVTMGLGHRDRLLQKIPDHTGSEVFALLSLGGIESEISVQNWPQLENVYWIVPDRFAKDRRDTVPQSAFGLSYIDLLASVDVVITKTGYGALVEAVAHQKPVLCVERGDWPEEAVLFPWCQHHGYLEIISYDDLLKGSFTTSIQRLLKQRWSKPAIKADGALQAAQQIMDQIGFSS